MPEDIFRQFDDILTKKLEFLYKLHGLSEALKIGVFLNEILLSCLPVSITPNYICTIDLLQDYFKI